MKRKKKKVNPIVAQIKAVRKKSREEEIATHGKPIKYLKIAASKKTYNRKRNKTSDME